MCSPELTKGLCQICTGTLTPENTHVDRWGNVWDIHKGVCAYHAGEVPPMHAIQYFAFMDRIHHASPGVKGDIIKSFYKWVKKVADEDHYDNSGPSEQGPTQQ